jgi:hypothetical protein
MWVWTRWAVTRAPKKTSHEMSEKVPFWGQLKVKAPKGSLKPNSCHSHFGRDSCLAAGRLHRLRNFEET